MSDSKNNIRNNFDKLAGSRDRWIRKNKYYHNSLINLLSFLIPSEKRVLEIGCGTGDLLAGLKTKESVGIDISPKMIEIAAKKYPAIKFYEMDTETLTLPEKFDYIVASDLINLLYDVENSLKEWHKVCNPDTRLVITYYNFLWQPLLFLAERAHFKMPQRVSNWLSPNDVRNILNLADFDIIKTGNSLLFPKYIPIFSAIINKYIARLPVLNRLCLVNYIVARPAAKQKRDYSVSVIIPARNEKGNIEPLIKRLPALGKQMEIIFVGGHSTDGTNDEIERLIHLYPEKDIKFFAQKGMGKGDAVRLGFDNAMGELLMILDADLSVAPEDLVKFYEAISCGKGEFINGSRLVYPMENKSMRFFNVIGNKFFSIMFSWLLDARIKDTLCGTKVLLKKDYESILANRKYFGDFDPFGDFDLLFGAAKLNLKIVELPVRYYARTYGETNIARWRHGWLLLKMVLFATKKIKFF
ncbi:MAG: bifunctional class I SAM-dependent methyltransferase/glycosyltransferase family 2 protein [bacterium]|nr:bifunctional class I SAM-dependent methyltransferase/glycosyltransferase family 2 protein [bacterium]